ncbi:MAG: bacteriorhodopsin, partial [Chitinophagales bacterium]|nr:bacteriorhodopsin [Hyphomicrobiales bacterium]
MEISSAQYQLVYNAFSFTVAVMGAATLFFWLGRSQVSQTYKTALTITGLVTAIAFYHYLR